MPDTTPRPRLEGQTIGGCRLLRRLGAGGMAEVYLAEQEHVGNRQVALKIVRMDEMATQHGKVERDDIATRFLREGKLLASFFHPNILPVHDSGAENGLLYLVMQYARDGSLAAGLHGRAPRPLHLPLELPLALDILAQVAAALQYTHDQGVVHRDVKPANILMQVEPEGRLRMLLADFGIATGVDATAHLNELTGTVAYMAPEQFRGYFSPASDQYSLAVMAYLLLTGRTPFEGGIAEQMYAHVHSAPPPLRAFNPDVPLAVSAAIVRGLAKSPEHRYPAVAAFAEALRSGAEPYADVTLIGAPPLDMEAEAATESVRHAADRGANAAYDGVLIFPKGGHRELGSAVGGAAAGAGVAARLGHARGEGAGGHEGNSEDGGNGGNGGSGGQRMATRQKLGLLAACVSLLLMALLVDIGHRQQGSIANGSPGRDVVGQHAASATSGTASSRTRTPSATQAPTATVPVVPTVAATQPPASPPTVAATTAFDAASISSPPLAPLTPGQHYTVQLSAVNTGATTWTSANGYVLTCDTVRHADARCSSALAASIGGSPIAPGGQVIFTLELTAPSAPGTYAVWLDMAHDNVLFSTADAELVVDVRPAAAPAQADPPTATPAPTAQPTDTATPQPTATPQDTATPTDTPTDMPTAQPTDTPIPSNTAPFDTPVPAVPGS